MAHSGLGDRPGEEEYRVGRAREPIGFDFVDGPPNEGG